MLDTSARLLRLLSLLQAHREWSGTELADRLGVTTRTVRRDVDRLRELGYPVHADAGVSGYRLGAGTKLPPLLLDDEEAVAVAVGLRTAAGGTVEGIAESSVRALAKLEQVLPPRLRHRVRTLGAMTVPLPDGGPVVPPDTLTVIAAACRDHETLRFDYRSHDGTESRREAQPHRLVSSGRRWYLVAYDPSRAGWRTFRVDRLTPRTPGGPRFTPREPPADDLAGYASHGLSTAPYRYQGRFTVHAPAARIAEHMSPSAATVEPLDARSCSVTAGSDSLDELALWVALLDAPFEVHGPPELAGRLRTLAERLADAANGSTRGMDAEGARDMEGAGGVRE
ncbi:helix-turn-helix transcriptional regulator [Streptomyces uncialis]|uniref:DeoR family transcriptional regulator n=1 Tax=Streptomyces uncialis TaxID=1048205 RepID=A0A1Q4VAY9_9ACTN|nr:YafY family protein [Streptomyces uncialis]OKH94870.1 DeoR family transcriptional regulator [Streptomyces uncialis]